MVLCVLVVFVSFRNDGVLVVFVSFRNDGVFFRFELLHVLFSVGVVVE